MKRHKLIIKIKSLNTQKTRGNLADIIKVLLEAISKDIKKFKEL